MTPSQAQRRRERGRKRLPGERYTTASYGRAVLRACRRFNVRAKREGRPELETWSPNQLRHAYATRIRREFGLEAAQVVLGHATADVTQIYAEKDFQHALRIADSVG